MRDLKFICCQPDDTYYVWQVHLWLESLKNIGHSEKAIVLVFTPKDRKIRNPNWDKIVDLYPEAKFYFYNDDHDISSLLTIYVSILRPYVLWRHFKAHPKLVSNAIFYCDCDILFTEKFNVDAYLEDDVNYVSDTNSYINASYFDSKIHDVLPEKLEEYKTRDILAEVTSPIGISREIAEAHNLDSGGAQYLLKNIDSKFWSKMMNDTILIRTYLQHINREFFANEDKGFQSWCADMWGLLWNLWMREVEVKVIPEMGFAWAPDPIEKLDTFTIYHNAGIGSELFIQGDDSYPCFYKGKYINGKNPFTDPQLEFAWGHEETKKHCTWYYTNALKELYAKYKIDY